MNRFSKLSSVALVAGLCLGAFPTHADLEVSADVQIHAVAEFEAPLTPLGSWVTVGHYGRCWRPARVAGGWRPYCDGHWEWTDCGWYWVTDEPWGWACYHYGTWTLEPAYGWIWVPGIEWAPSWVSWRSGGGYCGWAPLAPRGVVIAPAAFVFVEERHFRERHRPTTVIVNNTTIINKTKVINNIRREDRQIAGVGRQRVVVNEGPGAAIVERAMGQRITPKPIREVAQQTSIPREVVRRPAPETRVERSRPATQPAAPETRTPPRETRRAVPETRTRQPETRTAPPPVARTLPPETRNPSPQARTAPPVVRTPPDERSQANRRENVAPPPSRSPVLSPREMERRGSAGRAWRRGND